MEIDDIEISTEPDVVTAKLYAANPWGDRGYWIEIGGYGETERIARQQIDEALRVLGLTLEKIGKAI